MVQEVFVSHPYSQMLPISGTGLERALTAESDVCPENHKATSRTYLRGGQKRVLGLLTGRSARKGGIR